MFAVCGFANMKDGINKNEARRAVGELSELPCEQKFKARRIWTNSNVALAYACEDGTFCEKAPFPYALKENGYDYALLLDGTPANLGTLRKKLLRAGYQAADDAQVLIYAYIRFGMDAIKKTGGDFSLILFDEEKKRLIFYRSSGLAPPVYYARHGARICFSSKPGVFEGGALLAGRVFVFGARGAK